MSNTPRVRMVRLCCPSVIEVNVGVSVFDYSRYSLMRQQAYADQRENTTHPRGLAKT